MHMTCRNLVPYSWKILKQIWSPRSYLAVTVFIPHVSISGYREALLVPFVASLLKNSCHEAMLQALVDKESATILRVTGLFWLSRSLVKKEASMANRYRRVIA